jgi:hypothetical protein
MAKTKAEIKGLDVVSRDIKTFVRNIIKDKELLNQIGELASKQISLQTRAKQKDYKQPDLQKSTVERRETLIKQGNTSQFTKPKQSNLTLSGQLLDSITHKINQSSGFITLFFKEGRRPYKGKSGQNLENKTNKEIVQDLDQRGFKFFFISVRLKAQLESKIKSYLRQKLSNFKKLKRSLK